MSKLTVKTVLLLVILSVLFISIGEEAWAATSIYTVQPGDSLWEIAQKFETTEDSIKSFNNYWSNSIYMGQKLIVPLKGWVYTVKSGDSLWDVARKIGITVNSIKRANNLYSNNIKLGQKLIIPSETASLYQGSQNLDLLARLIHAEARGETFQGKIAVGAVILNRIENPRFPNTLQGVIFQKNAFESVANGQIWLTPDESAYKAARLALSGYDPTYGALYFYNPAKIKNPYSWIWTRKVIIKIGNHNFAI